MKNIQIVLIAIVLGFFIGCTSNVDKKQNIIKSNRPFSFDVSYDTILINPLTEYLYIYKTGTIIEIPENIFVDKQGNKVTTEVKLLYREFRDFIDFFISDIPLKYDSLGIKYQFESGGMCEIKAYSKNQIVYLCPDKTIKINMVSQDSLPKMNLYYLDSASKNWVYRNTSKPQILNLKNLLNSDNEKLESVIHKKNDMDSHKRNSNKNETKEDEIKKPLKPEKANPEKRSFSVDVQGYEGKGFPEFQIYKNYLFEIAPEEKNFNPKDLEEKWSKIRVTRDKKDGLYLMTFTNSQRQIAYLTRPVFNEKDYPNAKKEYEKAHQEYKMKVEAQRKKQIEEENFIKQKEFQKEQYAEIDKKKQFVRALQEKFEKQEEREREIRKKQANERQILKDQQAVRQRIIDEQERKNKEAWARTSNLDQIVIRSFSINDFGTWNCDRRIIISDMISNNEKRKNIVPVFVDLEKNKIEFIRKYYTEKGINTLYKFNSTISLNPVSKTLIWGITAENKLYFIKPDDIAQATKENENCVFKMNVHSDSFKTYNDVRNLLNFD